MNIKRLVPLVACIALTAGCSSVYQPPVATPPQVAERTMSQDILASLPAAKRKVPVAVYEFQDQTGQMMPNDTYASYSRAITQGGLAILSKALLDTSHKGWFTVIERGGIRDLLQERQVIRSMRTEYLGPNGEQLGGIKPMLYAGMILEGGIVAYESNVATGGAGAKYLGIGANAQYRRDVVTVYLRAVSSQTGEDVLSVSTSKTIYSTAVDSNVFRYVSFDKLLEMEAGFTINEPPQFAVRQAIEMAVYSLIMEGAMDHLWEFEDPQAGQEAIRQYMLRKNGSAATASAAPAAPVAAVAPAAPVPVAAAAPAAPVAAAPAAPVADAQPTVVDNSETVVPSLTAPGNLRALPPGRYSSRESAN